jgi:hypothetical protein
MRINQSKVEGEDQDWMGGRCGEGSVADESSDLVAEGSQ